MNCLMLGLFAEAGAQSTDIHAEIGGVSSSWSLIKRLRRVPGRILTLQRQYQPSFPYLDGKMVLILLSILHAAKFLEQMG